MVTANKREEKLNNVGLSITALSGNALAERKITSLQDVASAIPGLAYAQSATNTPILTLRGVGFNESSLGVYPAVSVYVDQAPLPFPVLASHSAFDLQRIEVLKGPQGTLFGQNSTGGAINYIAAKPTRSFTAGGDISYGRFNEIDGNAYLSGPITENLRARIAVSGTHTDDWQRSNSRPYDTNGKVSYITGRAIVDWDASDSVRFSLSLNAWRDTSDPQAPNTSHFAARTLSCSNRRSIIRSRHKIPEQPTGRRVSVRRAATAILPARAPRGHRSHRSDHADVAHLLRPLHPAADDRW
ncbi:TonB-dependent receptor plug domain-containing protein [Rhizorhabdus histidinilytica]